MTVDRAEAEPPAAARVTGDGLYGALGQRRQALDGCAVRKRRRRWQHLARRRGHRRDRRSRAGAAVSREHVARAGLHPASAARQGRRRRDRDARRFHPRARPSRVQLTAPMRALVVSYAFPPVGGAGVQRVSKLVKYLPDARRHARGAHRQQSVGPAPRRVVRSRPPARHRDPARAHARAELPSEGTRVWRGEHGIIRPR